MIKKSGVIELSVFSVLAPWWPSQEPDQTGIWSAGVVKSDRGAHTKFQVITLAVTKRGPAWHSAFHQPWHNQF
jgi:hypothetical protein